MPSSACLPLGARGPVSAMEKPILMGSWASVGASVGAAHRAAVRAARANRLAAPPGARSRNSFGIASPPGFATILPALYAGADAEANSASGRARAPVWELAHSSAPTPAPTFSAWRQRAIAKAAAAGQALARSPQECQFRQKQRPRRAASDGSVALSP